MCKMLTQSITAVQFFPDGDHQDLHSFPTRRSSDLIVPRAALLGWHGLGSALVHESGRRFRRSDQVGRQDAARDLDRKSTRLNSSHVANSYAVFCLKKKT